MVLSEGKNRIMIFGPKRDGTYVVEFRTSDGETLAISVPVGETRVLKHFSGTHALRAFRSRWSVSATGCPMEKDYLIVKCASASRPSGQWNVDDFDVLADGVVVGRRMMLLAR